MPLSDIVTGGPACGPSNPLQSLGKRFGQDRSTQLDRLDNGEGSSRQSFRAPRTAQQGPADPAFFQPGPQQQQHNAFDLQPLHGALPLQQGYAAQLHQAPLDLNSAWEQRQQQQQQSGPNRTKRGCTRHFEAAYRQASAPGPAEAQWAREYSPGAMASPALRQMEDEQQQQYSHQVMGPAARPMMGMSRMNAMNMRSGYASPMMDRSRQHSYTVPQQDSALQSSTVLDSQQWDTAFTSVEAGQKDAMSEDMTAEQAEAAARVSERNLHNGDADEFAKTAGRLVSSVEHEQNNKFKQSNFLNLMRKIRDKQAGIQGTDIVEQEGALADGEHASSTLNKGKSREVDGSTRPSSQLEATNAREGLMAARKGRVGPAFGCMPGQYNAGVTEDAESRQMLNDMWAEEDARSEAIESAAMQRSQAFVGDGGDVAQRQQEDEAEFAKYQNILGMGSGPAGMAATAFMQQQPGVKGQQQPSTSQMEEILDEDELQGADFVGKRWEGTKGRGVHGAQAAEWDALQKDWDAWSAGQAGFQPSMEAPLSAATAPQYRFHAYNPYLGSTTQFTQQGAPANMPADMQSVLEREAAVQADAKNASAWFDLGIKQQENEREDMAIAALQHAIQIDPALREAWLALAVSYTNESDRNAALEAIERWIDASAEYRDVVVEARKSLGSSESKAIQGPRERHERVTNLLMAIARHGSMQSKIDADVQVALGVLFNASEDYEKAVDCFQTALQVRPEDWLMYNRLGATLSNSGRSEEALQYYSHALELKPGFVRCHYNMSISCLNLKRNKEAAQHIYTALLLQSESIDAESAAGGYGRAKTAGSVTSASLWETLRVCCELLGHSHLARMASERNLDAIDPSLILNGGDDGMDGDMDDAWSGASAGLSGAFAEY